MNFRKQHSIEPTPLQLAPLVDVLLLLVIFFAVTSHYASVEQLMDVSVPAADTDPALAELVKLRAVRLLAGQGKHEEAIRWFDKARGLIGAHALPIDYRQGVAYQDLGEKDKARALLQRFVQTPRVPPNNLSDAKKRLKELG